MLTVNAYRDDKLHEIIFNLANMGIISIINDALHDIRIIEYITPIKDKIHTLYVTNSLDSLKEQLLGV